MRDTTQLVVERGQDPVTFWFEDYMVTVRFNNLVLGYDADIYKQSKDGSLVFFTTIGGKSVKQATQSARELILGNTR